MLKVNDLNYSIGSKEILKKICLNVKPGDFVGIIGPNGGGKSTLVKNISKLVKPNSGEIFLGEEDVQKMSNREMALKLAVVSQEQDAIFDFTVREVMEMGRYAHKKIMESINNEDEKIIEKYLNLVGMSDFMERSFLSLSGGEKQRVIIARALSQQTDFIILDEPTNHLDVGSQLMTMELLLQSEKTVFAALHDLGIAAKYCDIIYVVKNGEIITSGKPCDIITSELIHTLYGIDGEVFEHNGKIFIDYNSSKATV